MVLELDNKPLFGMIHLPRLTWDSNENLSSIVEYVIKEVEKLKNSKFDGIIIENFADAPFAKTKVSDIVISKLGYILGNIRDEITLPIGLNILRNACTQAINLATVFNLDFIRCNIWEAAYVTDQGIIEGMAGEVIECKKKLNSPVKILADVHVKHATPMGESDVVEAAKNAKNRGNADAIIISGKSTGSAPSEDILKRLNSANIYPILGSGLNLDNIDKIGKYLSGAIVGTSIKVDKIVTNPIDSTVAIRITEEWKNIHS